MGAMELQIFVSLLVVLGAAFVALICDFLKGNNEKLREFNIELVTRQEERERASVSTAQTKRSGQTQAGRVAEPGKPAEAPSNAPIVVQSPAGVVAEGIPAYPRRRRAGREPDLGPAAQVASGAQQPAPVAAIVAMEDWAKRVVEHSVSTRKAVPPSAAELLPVAAEPSTAKSVADLSEAVQPADAIAGTAIAVEAGLVDAVGSEIEVGSVVSSDEAASCVPDNQPGVFSNLPFGEIEALGAGPVAAGTGPLAIEVMPVVAVEGAGPEMPGQVDQAVQEPALPMAGLADLDTVPASDNRQAGSRMVPETMQSVVAAAGAGFSGLQRVAAAGEELAPPEAGLQPISALLTPSDAGRPTFLPEPRPVVPEFGAISNSEARAHRVQTEEAFPLAGAAELPAFLLSPATRVASPDAAPDIGFGGAEPGGVPSGLLTPADKTAGLAEAQPVPVSTSAAGFVFPARVAGPQAGLPGGTFDMESGSRLQPPDWTVEAEEPATMAAEAPEQLVSAVDEVERAFEATSEDSFLAVEEPSPEEVVRVRVLDESDLLQPCGLMDLPMEPVAAAAQPGHVPPAGLERRLAGLAEGPEIGGVYTSVPIAEAVEALPVAGFVAVQAGAGCAGATAPAAVAEPSSMHEITMALPRVPFSEQSELDFESIAAAAAMALVDCASEPDQFDPYAGPVSFELEPVADAGYHFIEVDNEPEMNPKVVQMPLPVQAAFESPARAALRIPRGIHDRAAFDELASQTAYFDGVVFLIGVMGFEHLVADHGQPAVAQAIGEATSYFDGLLSTDGFGCWIENSAFVMILPAGSGEHARQITTHTAEGLWDYQLRSLGSLPLIFHWGNSDASGEYLSAAVERAKEQMLESGRARKQVLTASGRFRRRVVNG